MESGQETLENFLNGLKGEVVSIIPNYARTSVPVQSARAAQPGNDLGFIRLSSIILSSSMPETMMSGLVSNKSAGPLSV